MYKDVDRLHNEVRLAMENLVRAAKRYTLVHEDYVRAVRAARKDKEVLEVRR